LTIVIGVVFGVISPPQGAYECKVLALVFDFFVRGQRLLRPFRKL